MITISGNLLDIEQGLIVHQVNCLGNLGGGIAHQIRERWPALFREYRRLCVCGELHPGDVHFFQVEPALHVANLAGQLGLGGPGGVATIYEAYETALPAVNSEAERLGLPVYLPKRIGCGLAGGDWTRMEAILERLCPNATLVEYVPALAAA